MFQEYQYYIIIGSMIAWMLPPLRQFREKYFYYFLILAINDLLVVFLFLGVSIVLPNGVFYTLASSLLYLALFNREELRKKKIIISLFLLFNALVVFLPGAKEKYLILCIIHTLIMYEFLKKFFVELSLQETFNLFLFLLVFYEMSIIIKFIVSLLDFRWGIIYFDMISILEIMLALSFAVFKERQMKFQKNVKD